ncbi:MAG: hypothetical protein HPY75_10285 [Actinobacteria bacterium]|nr:hypothetical protein [Actinomycetota bacterium]
MVKGYESRDDDYIGAFGLQNIELCGECGVPSYVVEELLWLDNGVVVQRKDKGHRLVIIECENLDPLFAMVGEAMGVSIEPYVVESRRQSAKDFVEKFLPEGFPEMLRSDPSLLEGAVAAQFESTRYMGLGLGRLEEMRYRDEEDDYAVVEIRDPFCLPLWIGNLLGGVEAIVGGDWWYEYLDAPPGSCRARFFRSSHPVESRSRFQRREYRYMPGDVSLQRCGKCGAPAVLFRFVWELDRGFISSAYTGRRVAINGETGLREAFSAMEVELGEPIKRAVVDAQRRFIKGGFYSIEGLLSEADFRTQFAFRGLGNLRRFAMGSSGLYMELENSTLHLMVVGFAQALFELAFGKDSWVEWELDEDEKLTVKVSPTG